MVNRINIFQPDAPMSYDDRIKILKERKLEETRVKSTMKVYQDGDDYGSIPAPETYQFHCIPNHENGSWYGYDGWSKNFYKLMTEHPVYIDPVDAFTCRWMFSMIWFDEKSPDKGLNWNPNFPYDDLKPEQELYGIISGIGSDAHFGGDYRIGLSLGWGGILEKLAFYRKKHPEHAEFYDAEELVVHGVQNWISHAIEESERLARVERHPVLRENLLQMAQVNRNILNGAPKTMREACQWVCWFNMASRTYNRDGAGFQLDDVLKQYYDADMKEGRITRDEAIFYIACLLLNDPHYYQIGGTNENGDPLLSEFSYMVLEGADKLDSACNITVRVDENIDRKFLNKAVDYLFKNKNGWPRFSGDEALNRGFMRLGYPESLARQRIAVGCHWMSLPGMEYSLNDCIKINSAKVFEVAMDEMMSHKPILHTTAVGSVPETYGPGCRGNCRGYRVPPAVPTVQRAGADVEPDQSWSYRKRSGYDVRRRHVLQPLHGRLGYCHGGGLFWRTAAAGGGGEADRLGDALPSSENRFPG